MAGFFKNLMDNAGKATQSAIEKSRELAEITKLNIDSGSAEDSIRQAKQKIGEYVAENNLLNEVPEVSELLEKIRQEKSRIAANNAKIAVIKAGSSVAEQKVSVSEAAETAPSEAEQPIPAEAGENIEKAAQPEVNTDKAKEPLCEESVSNDKESYIDLEKK